MFSLTLFFSVKQTSILVTVALLGFFFIFSLCLYSTKVRLSMFPDFVQEEYVHENVFTFSFSFWSYKSAFLHVVSVFFYVTRFSSCLRDSLEENRCSGVIMIIICILFYGCMFLLQWPASRDFQPCPWWLTSTFLWRVVKAWWTGPGTLKIKWSSQRASLFPSQQVCAWTSKSHVTSSPVYISAVTRAAPAASICECYWFRV